MEKLNRKEVIQYTEDLQHAELIPGALQILCFSKPVDDDLNSDELLDAVYTLRHHPRYHAIADYVYRRWMKVDHPHRTYQPKDIKPVKVIYPEPKKYVPRISPLVTNTSSPADESISEPKEFEVDLRKEIAHQLIYTKTLENEEFLDEVDPNESENPADQAVCELDYDKAHENQKDFFDAGLKEMMEQMGYSSLEEFEMNATCSNETQERVEISCIQGTSDTEEDYCKIVENDYLNESYGVMNTALCESYDTGSESEDGEEDCDYEEILQARIRFEGLNLENQQFTRSQYCHTYAGA